MRFILVPLFALLASLTTTFVRSDEAADQKIDVDDMINLLSNNQFDFVADDKIADNNENPITCIQYRVLRGEEALDELAEEVSASVLDLARLNPGVDIFSADTGTPLCIVGRLSDAAIQHYEDKEKDEKQRRKTKIAKRGKSSKKGPKKSFKKSSKSTGAESTSGDETVTFEFGRRPDNLVRYETTPGVDNCVNLEAKFNPPLTTLLMVELNPQVACTDIDEEPQTLFLPAGTAILDEKNALRIVPNARLSKTDDGDKDCLMGKWSEWSACKNGEKQRIRNIYQEASGNGIACASKAIESSACDENNSDISVRKLHPHVEQQQDEFLRALGVKSSNQCLKAADGCSNPIQTRLNAIHHPACNFHDICWACIDQWSWASESNCNNFWYWFEHDTCNAYWRHPFDKFFCRMDAYGQWYFISNFASPSYKYPETCPSYSDVVNTKLGGKYIGYVPPIGCECEGKSCDYRGEPYPCWEDGSICGIGSTCYNCCNGHEWWTSKFFTACGKEPCWGKGTICGAGTTCRECCNGSHCPWYQFGICTCN